MVASAESELQSKKRNFNPIAVKNQVPQWLVNSDSKIVDFLQFYYDWLTDGYGYTGINMMNMFSMFDIENTSEIALPHFIETYAPDIKGIYELGITLQPSPENIKNTITNIRTEVYQRKSNEDAFRALMNSLFSVNSDTINFSYPKRKILRLNGGRLDWMSSSDYYGSTGEYSEDRYTIVGSHLNQGVLPDSGMWQEFSYLITSEIDDSNPYYEAVVKETLHPAGLVGLYEKIERYSEGGFVPEPPIDYETPKVSNYYPYNLTSSESLPKCSGCTGNLFIPGWTFPTFVYPTWDVEIMNGASANFGSIRLWDFFTLNSLPGEDSPNDAIGTLCSFACDTSGEIDFAWFVGDTPITSDSDLNFYIKINDQDLTQPTIP
jgi:hypothetical protein